MSNIKVIGKKFFKETDGSFTAWIAIEADKKEIFENFASSSSNEEEADGAKNPSKKSSSENFFLLPKQKTMSTCENDDKSSNVESNLSFRTFQSTSKQDGDISNIG